MAKQQAAAARANAGRQRRQTQARASAAAGDDTAITALDLPPAPLSPEMAAYFAKCEEKLGFVPNVLKAYAFDKAQARGLRRHVQRPDAGAVRLDQARARDDRGRGLGAEPLLLLPRRPWRRGASAIRRSGARRTDGDELSRRAADAARARHARLRRQAHRRAVDDRGCGPRGAAPAGFSDRDIWDIAAVAGFFNMSNRVASATDMRPNTVYHAQAR